jgi:hypothetical protein
MGSRGELTLKSASGHEFFVSGSPSSLEQRTWRLSRLACPSEADYSLSRSERPLRVLAVWKLYFRPKLALRVGFDAEFG